MSKTALGRGLGALLASAPAAAPGSTAGGSSSAPAPVAVAVPDTRERVQRVRVERLRPCPLQPRKDFPPETLRELADSIHERGIVQPLIVRERSGLFEIIAGERRWRAAQLAGLTEVPVITREADDRAVLELALIENLQRENLNPIEEAQGYAQLIGQFELTQEEVAGKVGKSRAAVTNALRLLKLAPALQASVREGRLSVGHAKVILGLESAVQQQGAADRVVKDGLSVRQTEKLVARLVAPPAPAGGTVKAAAAKDPHLANLEGRLRERFGTKVQLRYHLGKGAVEIQFFTDEDLERILQIAGVTVE
jgi:ParB family chromosome partitioning protein